MAVWRSFRLPRIRLYRLDGEMDRIVVEIGGSDESAPLLTVFLNSGSPTDEALHSLCRQGCEVKVDPDLGRFASVGAGESRRLVGGCALRA